MEQRNIPLKVQEMMQFHDLLSDLYILLRDSHKAGTGRDTIKMANRLFLEAGRQSGHYKILINELTGFKSIVSGDREYDVWLTAFSTMVTDFSLKALSDCVIATNQAIGQLEEEVTNGNRDPRTGKMRTPSSESRYEPPKAFISHGKPSVALDKLETFLSSLGVVPLIVKEQPSLDKTVDDKVEFYLNQADFVVILATGDDEYESALHPRQNVIHEIGLAQKTLAGKIIYLLEEGSVFPSNIRPKVWERFKQEDMSLAFQCLIRELRALEMLVVTKQRKS